MTQQSLWYESQKGNKTKLNQTLEVAIVIVFTFLCLRVHCFSFSTDTCILVKVLLMFGLPHLFSLQS